ncbi:ABC transporter permease [Maledivibacter halophilus]|uniref:ABC-2 type transport system permease protein n=1 Tax=Maledivibacter halophilus TaxID=36842 RepID=A0A1T5M0I6_9FIRM|nr:ABC transporter permease [Maledivibacter halophilus]SKC81389.1 ABC-2 type transport system permease protein [Maledivibacter halophilus]
MKIIDILRKDLKIVLSDRKALITMIFMPIILSTILGFALSGSFMSSGDRDISKFNIAIVKNYNIDEELKKVNEELTRGMIGENLNKEEKSNLIKVSNELDIESIFFDEFLGSKKIKRIVNYRIEDEKTSRKLLEKGKVSAVVILPEDFIYDMIINFLTPFRNIVKIDMIGNPEYSIGFQIVEDIMNGFTDRISSIIIGKNVFLETVLEKDVGKRAFEDIETIKNKITNNIGNIEVDINYVTLNGKKTISSFGYYGAAMATMFILFAAGYGSKTLLEERDNMTYQRMVIAGISKWKMTIGKFFVIAIVALLQISIIILYSSIFFKVSWGNIGLIFLISICTVFSVAGLGIMIAGATFKAGNYKITIAFQSIIIQIMALIGGSYIPLETLPEYIQKISILSINGIALKSYLKCMMGYGIGELKLYLLLLLAMGVIFIFFGIILLRNGGDLKNA